MFELLWNVLDIVGGRIEVRGVQRMFSGDFPLVVIDIRFGVQSLHSEFQIDLVLFDEPCNWFPERRAFVLAKV